MRTFWQFLCAVFTNWASGITGGASAPFVIAGLFMEQVLLKILFGVFAVFSFVFAAYWVWRKPVKELEKIKSVMPVLEFGELEYDSRSSIFRLPVLNVCHNTGSVGAMIDEAFINEREPISDSCRLPVILEWMHHSGNESVQIGKGKLDVVYVSSPPVDGEDPLFLTLAGATFGELMIPIREGEKVYCHLAFHSYANQPLVEKWCEFRRPKERGTFDLPVLARLLEPTFLEGTPTKT